MQYTILCYYVDILRCKQTMYTNTGYIKIKLPVQWRIQTISLPENVFPRIEKCNRLQTQQKIVWHVILPGQHYCTYDQIV